VARTTTFRSEPAVRSLQGRVPVLAALAASIGLVAGSASAAPSRGLSLEQIRGVMRSNARAFNACLAGASRRNKPLHGPFVYQIQVDRNGKVLSARPYQPSGNVAFDRCVTGVLMHAKFPGGPASVETPLVFDPD
jgi:outer membrane biosynthesis protein TonB